MIKNKRNLNMEKLGVKRVSYRKRFYLASLNPDLEKEILMPKVPDNFLTRGKHEDWQVKRTCLYESIDDALSSFLGQELEGSLVYIYEPAGLISENLIKPGIMSVPYSLVLPEWWYCKPLRVRLTHVVQVFKKKRTVVYHYGQRQTSAKIFKWNWREKLDKYGKTLVVKRFSNTEAEETIKRSLKRLKGEN